MPSPDHSQSPIRYAVLCASGDGAALWAAGQLRNRGLDVRVVTTEELVYSASLTHRVSATGEAGCAVRLAGDAVLGPDLCGTLNRVLAVPSEHLARTGPDRDYAVQELHALLVSLLHGLPGVVVGRPSPRGLSGAWWRAAEWAREAARAGLPAYGYRTGGSDPVPPALARSVLVVGDEVLPCGGFEVPSEVADGCRALARRYGSGLLGLELAAGAGSWALVRGNPYPDLRRAGAAGVDALAAALGAAVPA